MKYLDDVQDGDQITGMRRVRGTSYIVEHMFSEIALEMVMLLNGKFNQELFDEFSGRPMNAETAHAMADWIRENV